MSGATHRSGGHTLKNNWKDGEIAAKLKKRRRRKEEDGDSFEEMQCSYSFPKGLGKNNV